MILSRYVQKEIAGTVGMVTLVLLLILLCHQSIRYLHQVADGHLGLHAVVQLLVLQIPVLLTLLLPLGWLLGLVLVYGRLYADREAFVLMGAGISRHRLFSWSCPLGLLVFALVSILMLWAKPYLYALQGQIWDQAGNAWVAHVLPQRFESIPGSDFVVYAGSKGSEGHSVQQIFLARQSTVAAGPSPQVRLILAKSAEMVGQHLVLRQGYYYQGIPGKRDYRIVQFGSYHLPLPVHTSQWSEKFLPTKTLWFLSNHSSGAAAELQWRLAIPISVLLFMGLGLLLAPLPLGAGRYAHLLPALLVYIIYVNSLFLVRAWIKQGIGVASWGMWCVQGLLLVGMILWYYTSPEWRRSWRLLC